MPEDKAIMQPLIDWATAVGDVGLAQGIELLTRVKAERRQDLLRRVDVLDGKDPDAAPKTPRARRSDAGRPRKATIRHHENVEPVTTPEAPATTNEVLDLGEIG